MSANGRRERNSREGVSHSPTEQLGYGSSSSINLLEISDLAQVDINVNRPEEDTIRLANPGRGIYQLQFKDDDSDVSSVCSDKSEKSSGSDQAPTSSSQVSDFKHESGGNVMSPTQSPPVQIMDRVGGNGSYDPLRIPSSVFQRSRSTTPLEWSIASNESLFSIQVGHSSFSRDHALILGEVGKSSELTKSDELRRPEESFVFTSPSAVITSRETEMKSAEFEEELSMADTIEFNIKDKEGLIEDDLSDLSEPPPAVSWTSCSKSRHSDRSQSSSDSFAFPIKKKCACPSRYCSNCSRSFCYCSQPRCSTWLACCCWNCSRTFSYCWNCGRKDFVVTPLTFWPIRKRRVEPCLQMLNFKALQSLQNQQQSVVILAVRVLVSNGVVVHVHVTNAVVRVLLVSNGRLVSNGLPVSNGVAVRVLVSNGLPVSNGIAVRVLVSNGVVVVHVLLVTNGVVRVLLATSGVVVHVLLATSGVVVHVLLASGVAVRVLLVANGIAVHVLLVANGIAVHVLLVANATSLHVHLVGQRVVVVVMFALAVIVLIAIFTPLVIFAIVVKRTMS